MLKKLTGKVRLILVFSFSYLLDFGECLAFRSKPQPTPYHDFDYFIFSQRWPLTTCAEWEATKSGNTCNLPQDKHLWTIHGIWPTKTGQEGPLFCPSSIHFNPDELAPIINDLTTYWVNVEANTKLNSFWAHEWKKHGTCASVLPLLDSVTNYFRMGLKWNRDYDIASILSKEGIEPGNSYDVATIYNAIKNSINKEPSIQCVIDKETKESYISEIRICLDKNFQVIDCNPTNPIHRIRFGLNTNCSQKKQVQYIASITPTSDTNYRTIEKEYIDYQGEYEGHMRYLSLYNFLWTLMWLTL
ncbi:hypothetical protein ABEB36_006747 [Hypothenemus hampei]|uniref:Uncharacterized protein n=1 Tax=Hypothenemus hampei TaxID=57062 RepID=A0ABD1ERL6_HYPHA